MTRFRLKLKERTALEHFATSTHKANELRRAQGLLWLDKGERVQAIAERLGVSRQTVYNWATRFQMRRDRAVGARVSDGARRGRPRTARGVIDAPIDAVIDCDPRELGYRSTTWTAALLVTYLHDAHEMDVSCSSVRAAIRRLRIRWKRPRHHLALRAKMWRQAKGG